MSHDPAVAADETDLDGNVFDHDTGTWVKPEPHKTTEFKHTGKGKKPIIPAVEEAKKREDNGEFLIRESESIFVGNGWGDDTDPRGDGSRLKPFRTLKTAEWFMRRQGKRFLVVLPFDLKPRDGT